MMSSNNHTSSSLPSTATTTTTFTSTLTTDSDLKLDELSGVETTVPTDFTLSPESDFGRFTTRTTAVTRQLLERKQLLHDLQLLKIELSQKNLICDNLKADFMSRSEEMEEKLAEAVHARQITQAMLEARLSIQEDDTRQKLEENRLETVKLYKNCKELEEKNARLMEQAANDRRMLINLELNQKEYLELQKRDPEHLSLRDHVSTKVYEIAWPYKLELQSLKSKLVSVNDVNNSLKNENQQLTQIVEAERSKAFLYQTKCEQQEQMLKDVEERIKTDDFKINNFEQIKMERDKLMSELFEVERKASVLEVTNAAVIKEVESLKAENVTIVQKSTLLQQDKEYLSKRLQELSSQNKIFEDQLSKSNLQVEKMSAAREEIYERYVSARDMYKTEFDRKMKEEIDAIQSRTWSEIELLRRTAKDVYEQEIRSLKNARDNAISDKTSTENALRQNLDKCEKYLEEIHVLKGGGDSELLSIRNQLLLKGFEVEQLKLVSSEVQNNYKACQLEREKLLKKIDVFDSELKRIELDSGKRINELESQLSLSATKLSSYEALERDLHEALVNAAQAGDDEGRIVTLFDQPSTTASIKGLQHSFQLAKRILVLEKLNSQMKLEIETEKQAATDLAEEVESCNRLLNDSDKPNAYLIETIRSRNQMIKQDKHHINELQTELENMKRDKEQMRKRIELLTVDVENLLKNKEEITKMKKLLTSFFPHLPMQHNQPKTSSLVVQRKILPKGKTVPIKSSFR